MAPQSRVMTDSAAFQVAMEEHEKFLLASARGPATLADFFVAIDRTAEAVRRGHYRRVLIDLRETQQNLKFTEHLALGARVAERLAFVERVATIVTQQSRSGSSEKAAQKTGLHLRTFTDFKEALAWVVDDE